MVAVYMQHSILPLLRSAQIIFIWFIVLSLINFSIGRNFGTDIDNYIYYFNSWYTEEAGNSLEPLYLLSAELLQNLGISPTAVIELTAFASLALIAVFASRQRHPLATLVILLGWMLLQQVWGTIRMGLGVCLLLFANEIYIRRGRVPYWTYLATIFHWSLLANPLMLMLRWRAYMAVLLSVGTYVAVVATGSVRDLFFALLPPQIGAIANYAVLQNDSVSTTPSPVPLAIHLALVYALTKTCSREELPRFLGPLTLLYCGTCLFFDFDQAGGRVANILISMKLLALIRVYDKAECLSSNAWLVRIGILSYCTLVAAQYYFSNVDYF